MISKITHILFLSFFITSVYAQETPITHKVDWSKAGCNSVVLSKNRINFRQKQQKNPKLSNNDLIDKIIDTIEKGGTIYFPNGRYNFERTIRLKSNISIIGENRDSVIFSFDNHHKGDLITMIGRTGKVLQPQSNLETNQNTLSINSKTTQVGRVLYLVDNDIDLITNDWAKGSTGQLFQVTEVKETEIALSNLARRPYKLENQFLVKEIFPIENSHIRNISITRANRTELHSSNIFINYGLNCSVENVRSYKCSYSHIAFEKSLNCSINNCVFTESLNYGNGGNGYGVVLQFGTSDCKIENNCFCTLRHAMLAQCGANGNVFTNNNSQNPFWTGTLLPSHSAGDIVLHGNYPYANLFHNNNCQQIVIDNSHGKNGHNNCFSENTIESYGIHMNKNSGDNMLFINNKITRKGILKGRYKIKGKNHIEQENLRKNKNL